MTAGRDEICESGVVVTPCSVSAGCYHVGGNVGPVLPELQIS